MPMSIWLRLLSVVLIALLVGSASVATAGYGPRAGVTGTHQAMDVPADPVCDGCAFHGAVGCVEACAGSMLPEHDPGVVDLVVGDAFLTSLPDDLREGVELPPRLAPPRA